MFMFKSEVWIYKGVILVLNPTYMRISQLWIKPYNVKLLQSSAAQLI